MLASAGIYGQYKKNDAFFLTMPKYSLTRKRAYPF